MNRRCQFRRSGWAWAACAWVLIGVSHTVAGPENPQVVHGSADFEQAGPHTTINVSHRAIIDYSAFDLTPRESVRFVQPSTQSRVLNRIVGGRPTTLAGTLAANGRVYFVNPQGVYFARSARIDASRFYAIGGRLANADFLAGVDRFTNLTGPVLNEGAIHADQVHLAGSTVGNHGNVRASSLLTMVAGDEVVLTEHGSHLSVRVDGSNLTDGAAPAAGSTPPAAEGEAAVENRGTLDAPGGTVVLGAGDLVSLAIRNRGLIRAEGGDVTLAATDGAVVNRGVVDVSVATGRAGTVAVKGPAVANTGTIRADAEAGEAGRIAVIGDAQVRLPAGGRLSAAGGAGAADGGTVIVDAPRGHAVLAEGARIDASGGRLGGAGGFVELSGESLIYSGDVDLASTDGRHGTLLIDPFNLHFVAGAGSHDSLADDGVILFDDRTRRRTFPSGSTS